MGKPDRIVLVLVAGLMIASVLVAAATALRARPPSEGASCDTEVRPPLDRAQTAALSDLPQVSEQQTIQRRDLERSRDRATLRTFFSVSPPLPDGVTALNVRTGPFQRADGKTLEPEQVTASATVDPAGRLDTVEVAVCIDPVVTPPGNRSALVADAGSYTGTVFIDDPRVTGGSATYEINMKYDRLDRVLLVVLLAMLLGSATGLALATGLSWNTLYQNKGRTFSAVVASISAVFVVYNAQYDSDPSWEGSTSLFTALFATALGAAYAATHVAGTLSLQPANDRAQNGQDPPGASTS
jgi:hypothetical protein